VRRFRYPAVFALAVIAIAAVGCGRRISEGNESEGDQPRATEQARTTAGSTETRATAPSLPAPTPAPARAAAVTGETWNAAQIAWQPYEAGLRQARAEHKPVCLVFSTTWCPHCKNYSHVFDDQRVVARARDFVMIHLDADVEETVAAKYALDGSYIPRTFFLSPDGTLDDSIHAARARSRFFYDEHDPGALLAAMETAHQKLVN
jgi:thiol:disulfide interchange protein